MREPEEPGLGLVGRERAALIPEQLRFEQIVGNRRTVDVDERSSRAGARPVDGPHDEALAGAGLAAQEDRRGAPAPRRPREGLLALLPPHPEDAGCRRCHPRSRPGRSRGGSYPTIGDGPTSGSGPDRIMAGDMERLGFAGLLETADI